MDLDELQSVQSRERQTDSLQQLRATFYQDAAEYIHSLETERDRAADRADDPWNSPEVGRLNDDIDTAEQTVEAIYERRVGKIVKMASLAAADMPTETEGLTEEEGALFDRLVTAIEENRDHVFAILDGEDPVSPGESASGDSMADPQGASAGTDPHETDATAKPDPSQDVPPDVPVDDAPGSASEEGNAPPTEERVDAADLMAGGPDGASGEADEDARRPVERSDGGVATGNPQEPDSGPARPPEAGSADRTGEASDAGSGESRHEERPRDGGASEERSDTGPSGEGDGADVDRSTVRITSDVGEIFGVDERAYDLTADDVVTLPESNVGPLLESGAAERLD